MSNEKIINSLETLLKSTNEVNMQSSKNVNTNTQILTILQDINTNIQATNTTTKELIQYTYNTCNNVITKLERIEDKLDYNKDNMINEIRKKL